MLQQWRLEAHRLIEGNRKWDIWLHDWELEWMRHNVQAWFWWASLHMRAVPGKVPSRPEEGWFKVCVLLLWRLSHAESFYLGREELSKPCSGFWNPVWNSPRALTWRCSLAVTPVAAHRVSGDHLRLWSFPLRNTGLGEGNRKMILILHYTESLALLTVAYCFLPQSSAQSLSGRGYSVSHFTANSFTSVDVDCRGLHYLLHSHWHGRNAEQKQGESTGLFVHLAGGTALMCESALRAWGHLNFILYL